MINRKIQGKRNLASGRRFEAKVRADLEQKRFVVSKWQNNVELLEGHTKTIWDETSGKKRFVKDVTEYIGRLIPARQGRFRRTSTGFPDFIVYKMYNVPDQSRDKGFDWLFLYDVQGVEVKSNGYLTKEEKEKCRWLFNNNIFSKILIAKKGKKRGEIIYKNFGENDRRN